MVLLGLLITFCGFLITFAGLGTAASVSARMAITLAGILVSLAGIGGVINRAYLRNPIWKR